MVVEMTAAAVGVLASANWMAKNMLAVVVCSAASVGEAAVVSDRIAVGVVVSSTLWVVFGRVVSRMVLDISHCKRASVISRSLCDLVWLAATDGTGGFCGSEIVVVSEVA